MFSSVRSKPSHCPKVGDPRRTSTTTSWIAPRPQRTSLAAPRPTEKCIPRTTPRREREWLSWTISSWIPSSMKRAAPVGLAEEAALVAEDVGRQQDRAFAGVCRVVSSGAHLTRRAAARPETSGGCGNIARGGLTRRCARRFDPSRRSFAAAHRHLRQLPVAARPRPAAGPAAPSAARADRHVGGVRRLRRAGGAARRAAAGERTPAPRESRHSRRQTRNAWARRMRPCARRPPPRPKSVCAGCSPRTTCPMPDEVVHRRR